MSSTMQRHPLLRLLLRAHTFKATSYTTSQQFPRTYATKRGPADYTEEDLSAARKWLANLNPDTIPRNLCEITFSRSSGPGGQNVNK
jgi:peptidyl-tRNA hydrolase ICT1